MLLMANPSGHDQPARLEPREFALRRSGAGAGVPNQLRCVEATLGLAEEQAEDALLCLGQQSVRQTLAARSTRTRLHTQYGNNYARFGHERQREFWGRKRAAPPPFR